MILEDDAYTSAALAESLKDFGLQTFQATDAATALQYVAPGGAQAFIVDLNLGPGRHLEGLEVLRQIRYAQRDAFIAVYTSFATERFESARQLGADMVLSKTAVRDDVNRLLAEWVGRNADHLAPPEQLRKGLPPEEIPKLGSDFVHAGLVDAAGRPLSAETPPPIEVVDSIVAVNSELLARVSRDPEAFHALSPRQFEEVVAEMLTRLGYGVTLTPQTRDGGFDILAARRDAVGEFLCLVECKRYVPPHTVGVSLVRSLHGVLEYSKANAAMLVTSSTFSRDAKEYVRGHMHRLLLHDYLSLREWLREVRQRPSA